MSIHDAEAYSGWWSRAQQIESVQGLGLSRKLGTIRHVVNAVDFLVLAGGLTSVWRGLLTAVAVCGCQIYIIVRDQEK